MAQEQNAENRSGEPATSDRGGSEAGRGGWSPPWLNWTMDSHTGGMRDAVSAWSDFVTEQCRTATSYDPNADLGAQASEAWRKYAQGVASLSRTLMGIAAEVYGIKHRAPTGDAADDDRPADDEAQ